MDKTRPISPPGRIAIDAPAITTRLQLLEAVNRANMRAAVNDTGKTYWTTTVLYNTVVYERDQDGVTAIHETFAGVLK
jgi:hypothetical protein